MINKYHTFEQALKDKTIVFNQTVTTTTTRTIISSWFNVNKYVVEEQITNNFYCQNKSINNCNRCEFVEYKNKNYKYGVPSCKLKKSNVRTALYHKHIKTLENLYPEFWL